MNPPADDFARVAEALTALQETVARLNDRIAALEAVVPVQTAAKVAAAVEPARLDDELVTVIAAAVAAFLGKKAHVRQVRLIGTAAWSMQGRVTIQASHSLAGAAAANH